MALTLHYLTIDARRLRYCNTANKETECKLIVQEFSFEGYHCYPMTIPGYVVFVPPPQRKSLSIYYAICNPNGVLMIMCRVDGKIKCVAKAKKGTWCVSCV